MRKTILVATLSACLVALGLGPALQSSEAAVMDLVGQFPMNQGDNGFYLYGYDYTSGVYHVLTGHGNYTFDRSEYPYLYIPSAYLNSPVGWIFMHPSSSGFGPDEDIVLGYQVSQSGFYNISGRFWLDGSAGMITSYIKAGAAELWTRPTMSGGSIEEFSLSNVFLSSGSYLYFGINAAGSADSDWGHLQGQISQVPVPAAVLLFGPGLIALAAFRRRIGM